MEYTKVVILELNDFGKVFTATEGAKQLSLENRKHVWMTFLAKIKIIANGFQKRLPSLSLTGILNDMFYVFVGGKLPRQNIPKRNLVYMSY